MISEMQRHDVYALVNHGRHNLRGAAAEHMLDLALEELHSLRLAVECERRADSGHDQWTCPLCYLTRRMWP